jgi:aspartate/methionine/tyrosine aminotransferase
MVDELWEDIIFNDRRHVSLASLNPEIADLTITAWGFSKTWGVAGLQIGYLCSTNMNIVEDIRKHARGIMRGTNTLANNVAPIMLSEELNYWKKEMMDHLYKIKKLCSVRLTEMGDITVPELEGTYLMFPRFNYNRTSQDLYNLFFKEAKVSFSVGTEFGTEGEAHLRMCIATSESIINEVLDRLEMVIKKF